MRKLLFVFALAACGGGGGGGAGTPQQAVQAQIDQTCSIAFECRDSFPPDQGFAFEDLFGNSEAECAAFFESVIDPAAVQASADAGRVIYDSADAQACLDSVDALSCDQFWGTEESQDDPACDTAFVGTVADGGSCSSVFDCSNVDSSCDEETMTCG